jgi:MFS transporter, PAT family, beta-lactamase induction signal transducer AmpG
MREMDGSEAAAGRPLRPWLTGFLVLPMAVLVNGFTTGALSYLLRIQGVDPGRGSEIIALLSLPATIYFLWSPITDFLVRRRTWLMAGALVGAFGMLVAFYQPSLSSPAAVAVMFVGACFGQLVVAACGGLMGTLASEADRRRASSFYQGASLAGGAVALSVLVALADRVSAHALGWITAAMIAVPAMAAFAVHEVPVSAAAGAAETLRRIWGEFKQTFLRWRALPYALTMVFPMASGAMIGLLPGLAADYHVSGEQVAWINGLGGALLMAAGAFAASLLPARMSAPIAYLSTGLLNALVLAVMWLGPATPAVYLAGTVMFLFTIGVGYAFFTAVVLEFLGGSGKSGSGRYAIINSLGNIPVAYMTYLDGRSYALWGARAMPGADTVLSTIGALLLLGYFVTRKAPTQAA